MARSVAQRAGIAESTRTGVPVADCLNAAAGAAGVQIGRDLTARLDPTPGCGCVRIAA